MRQFVVLLAGVVVACGSSKAAPDALTGPTAAEACQMVSAARCERLMACSPSDVIRRWTDVPSCLTRETLSCMASFDAPGTGTTPANTELCATELTAQACPAFVAGLQPPPHCIALPGAGTVGAPCEFNGQCATAFCAVATDALCGTCEALPQPGDACADNACGPTLSCNATSMMCEQPGSIGDACSKTATCGDGDTCVGATTTVNGTCMADVTTVGAACDATHKANVDCDLDDGLACGTTTNECATLPIAAAGAACGNVNDLDIRCAGGATCVLTTGLKTGTCVAPAADGEPCDTVAGPGCWSPAKCVVSAGATAGTCTLPASSMCQ